MIMQRSIFKVGERYRAKRTFVNGRSTFTAGEVLVFERDGYSPYDSSFMYEFRSESGNDRKEWVLHEDEPATNWEADFECLATQADSHV